MPKYTTIINASLCSYIQYSIQYSSRYQPIYFYKHMPVMHAIEISQNNFSRLHYGIATCFYRIACMHGCYYYEATEIFVSIV